MVGWRFVLIGVLSAAIASLASAAAPNMSAGDHRSAAAQSNREFQAQVTAIIQSYRKHDTAKGRQLIDQFRLANAKEWFAAHLNPARSEEFASRYDRLYANFADSFELTVKDIVADKGTELGTKVESADERPAEDLLFGGK